MSNKRDEVINAVLEHHDITHLVSKYVHLTKRGRNLIGLCPFHSEKTPSFTVSPEKRIFHCFGCGVGGNVIKFVMEIEGYSFPEALAMLAEEANIPFQPYRSEQTEHKYSSEQQVLIQAHDLAAKWFHYVLKNSEHGMAAMNYLQERGFTEHLIDAFQIGYAPPLWDTLTQFLEKRTFDLALMEQGGLLAKRSDGSGYVDRFRDRIMFPICDHKGKVIAFAGRVLQAHDQPKYLNTPETVLFNKRNHLYHYHGARATIRKSRTIVLFEGYADVIKAWDAQVHHGVATMGTALTEEHVNFIKRHVDHVIICYDGDDAGQAAAYASLQLLEKHRLTVSVAVIPDQLDPDDYMMTYGAEPFKEQIIGRAWSATQFKLAYMKNDYNLQQDQGKLDYIQAAIQTIAKLPLPTEREHYLQQLSAEFEYSIDALKQQLNEARHHFQKTLPSRDNNDIPWNNVMNDRRAANTAPALLPAYHNAERHLLCLMMHNRHIAYDVQQEIADQFNVELHAVIAAYLYAFYADHDEPNVSQFILTLQDEALESAATAISLLDIDHNSEHAIINDYIQQIRNHHHNNHLLQEKRQEMRRAERAGQLLRAAEIATEINTLERQLRLR